MSYTKGTRYSQEPSNGGQNALYVREIQTPAYAASVKITVNDPLAEDITVLFKQCTGNMTITADTTIPYDGDQMIMKIPMDSTGHTVTLSNGFTVTSSTIIGTANSIVTFNCIFDAQTQTWVEYARAIN